MPILPDEPPEWPALRANILEILNERDRTYQQRWEASEKAVLTALLAQKEAVYAAFTAQEKAIAAALTAADRAVAKAEIASEKRFDSVNEFRAQLSDQAQTFLPRAEFDRANTAVNDKMDSNNKALVDKIEDLRSFKDSTVGRGGGMSDIWIIMLGVLALADAIFTAFIAFRH
jgi:hypothetical protein